MVRPQFDLSSIAKPNQIANSKNISFQKNNNTQNYKPTKMSTFFDEQKLSFSQVPIENGKIATSEFLEACQSILNLFGMFN